MIIPTRPKIPSADLLPAAIGSIRQRIDQAARRAGCDPGRVRLIAVSKGISAERIQDAIHAGITDLGENRIQEAIGKIPQLSQDIVWHMIGHLQTNKARDAVRYFSLIHSVDRWELAERLSREGERQGKTVPVLVQVNVAGEVTKGGFAVQEVQRAVEQMVRLPCLEVQGLMTIAPYTDDPEKNRPHFHALKKLFDDLRSTSHFALRTSHFNLLSMGMSHDFEVAVEEGATMVRIGTAIFGERIKPA